MRERELDLRHDSRHQRSVLITIVAAAHIVGHLLAPGRRLQRTRWGAHADEPDPSLANAPRHQATSRATSNTSNDRRRE